MKRGAGTGRLWDAGAKARQKETGVLYNRIRTQVYHSVLSRAGGDTETAEGYITAASAEWATRQAPFV